MAVIPPTGQLPAIVRGRDDLVRETLRLLRRPADRFVVLTGMGGVGKSTVAATIAERVQRSTIRFRHPHVWWVSAADPASLIGGLVTVARELQASSADIEAIDVGRPDAPDRLWALLHRSRRRWMLVLDNADDPSVLGRPVQRGTGAADSTGANTRSVGAGTGWLRWSRRGLVVVTSRDANSDTWGRHACIRPVEVLDEAEAAQVLLDRAPSAGTHIEARRLARRLGCLPLVLGAAGSYLKSDVALRRSFLDYQHALDEPDSGLHLLKVEDSSDADARDAVMRTWEISLDALARGGIPQARVLLRLLSCYAPTTPIPLDLFQPEGLVPLFAACRTATQEPAQADAEQSLERGLRRLRELGLINVRSSTSNDPALIVHPIITDTNRAHLLVEATGEVDAASVWGTSVELITARLDSLSHERPADWPTYRDLDPHLHALFETVVPHIDREHLASLVHAAARTARAHDWSGAVPLGERLTRATFDAVALLGEDHPASLLLRHQFAWQRAIQGHRTEAEATYRDNLDRCLRVLGDKHPDTLRSRHELAWVTAIQGRWAEAEAAYREVIEMCRQVLGDDHPDTLFSRHELAWAIANQGRGEAAEAALHDVLDARRRVLGDDHPNTLASRHELAWATAIQGRWAEAEAAYRDVIEARRRVLGNEHPDTLTARHEFAWITAEQGRHKIALTEYAKVLEARTQVLGVDHDDTADTCAAIERLRQGQTTPAAHLA